MPLDISQALRNPGERIPFDHPVSIPPQDILGEVVTFDDPAQMKGTMCLTEGRLRLKGKLTAMARAQCAKCLAPATHRVQVRFEEVFVREGQAYPDQDNLEPSDRLAYQGPRLAVDQLAMTLAVLDLPIRFLCREDCPGMDWTPPQDQTHAGQKELPLSHPFSALQQLLNKDQEV